MKKYLFLSITAFITLALMAEDIPAGYYNSIDGKKDSVLKSTLSQIIYPVDWSVMTGTNSINEQYNAGNRCKYGTRAKDEKHQHKYTWDGFWYTDTREDGSVWDMYSLYQYFMAPDSIGAVSLPDLEIEHCFPKSWWGTTDNDAYKDLHHLNPANLKANGPKSNNPPGYVETIKNQVNEIFKLGTNSKYGKFTVYEPDDEYKGDFARAYFYIATAYENFTWDVDKTSDYLNNSSYLEFKPWLQQVLIEWHRLDPVSEKEINRNNLVSDIQHNRNPFIDYPELAEYIWGNKQGQTVQLSSLEFTGSENYDLPPEKFVSRAQPATNISANGFTANWKNAGKECYQLDVFTSTTIGHNDTILNLPNCHQAVVKKDNRCAFSGSLYTSSTGMSSFTTLNATLTISSLELKANSKIVVRAMAPLKPATSTDGAQMKISADGVQVALPTLTHDEEYFSFALPTGTKSVTIEPGNGKHINVQQIFIITGDETTTHTSLPGYPKEVTGTSYAVDYTMVKDQTLYYTVTPDGLRTSVPVPVTFTGKPTDVTLPDEEPTLARKEIRNGQVVIIRNTSIYTPLGQVIR